MTATVPVLLQPLKDRLAAANLGPLGYSISDNRKWGLLLENSGTGDERLVAKCVDDEEADLFMNAPTDQAKLIAAVEGVLAVADRWEEDFPHKAWQVRAALTQALGGDGA